MQQSSLAIVLKCQNRFFYIIFRVHDSQAYKMIEMTREYSRMNISVFCPGFQKGRVPSEKGIVSVVSGP